ncbi:helix-turn-helix domain-containing protein [Streptomyces anulatus]|uniref:helix-turn-helix domain-containing protein n=1 Tax=Streptomyces anulatus TaxID=1892 RepID=UPI0033E2860C
MVFTDRVLVTLLHLRTGFPHVARYGIARSTVSRAIGETRPLLAARGLASIHAPGVRLRGCTCLRRGRGDSVYESDGVENQDRHPKAGHPGQTGLRARQEETEHNQDHRHRCRTACGGRPRTARSHARPALRTRAEISTCR